MIDPNPTSATIANGGTTSGSVRLTTRDGFTAMTLIITVPGTLTGSVTIEVSADDEITWGTLESNGSAIAVTVSRAIPLTDLAGTHLRFKSTLAELADRVFKIAACPRARR